MKVLIAADFYYPQANGCAYFAHRLALHLQKSGVEVMVIAPSETMKYSATVRDGIHVFGIRSFPILYFYSSLRFCVLPFYNKKIEEVIDEFKPDVIHCQFHFAINRAVIQVAQRKNIPMVATNHFLPDSMFPYLPFSKWLKPVFSWLAWRKFAKVYRKVHQITTPTHTAAAVIQRFFVKQVLPISCGIDLTRFKTDTNKQSLYPKYNIPENKNILLYVGRLDKEKNLDLIIKASASAIKKSNFHLVIAGTGTIENDLIKLAAQLNFSHHMTLTGFVQNEDLAALYCLADCFIIASTAELQSIVTMEAMACGLPVIAANAVALPELVKHSENGYLFQPNDIQDAADKIVEIFNHSELREQMGHKSQEIVKKHDIEKVLPQFMQVYQQVCAEKTEAVASNVKYQPLVS